MSVRHENARSATVRAAAWIGFGLSCACAVPASAGAAFINHTAKQRIEGFSHEALLRSADNAILAVGQIESVDVNARAVVVLGQRFVDRKSVV